MHKPNEKHSKVNMLVYSIAFIHKANKWMFYIKTIKCSVVIVFSVKNKQIIGLWKKWIIIYIYQHVCLKCIEFKKKEIGMAKI